MNDIYTRTSRYLSNISIPAFLAFLFIFSLLISPGLDDVWWRLASGQHTLQKLSVLKINSWSFSSETIPWVNHSWLYDVIIAKFYNISGLRGLFIFHFLLLSIIIYKIARPPEDIITSGATIGALFLLTIHWAVRPFLAGDLFLLGILFYSTSKNLYSLKGILGTFLIFLFWANIHGSATGGLVVFIFLIFSAEKHRINWFFAHAFIGFSALLINPSGGRLLLLSFQYMQGGFAFLSSLIEWGPPNLIHISLMIFILSVLFLKSSPSRKLTKKHILLAGLFIYSMTARRNVPLFAITSLYYLYQDNKLPLNYSARLKSTVFIISTVMFSFIIKPTPDNTFYPIKILKASETLNQKEIINVFVPHKWGGAFIFHFKGRFKPFVDARNDCYSEKVFKDYYRIYYLQKDWYDVLNSYRVDYVIFPSNHPLFNALRLKNWQPSGPGGQILKAPYY
ncbi:hypothetical protein KKF34_19900 [Myxococcota bacterium]|nr:hypothetical protein [Myxococcota bacterium]MBU1380855.1 hypothetical protein [Myxococcota bacterium]MBU1499152.1 hypothetical protein [Myxococcota bacterium]